MKRVEYFPKKTAEREAALVASPASGSALCAGRKYEKSTKEHLYVC
jgi:hypothetical protein